MVDTVIRGEDLLSLLGLGDTRIMVEGNGVLAGFCGCGVHSGGCMSIGLNGCEAVKVHRQRIKG